MAYHRHAAMSRTNLTQEQVIASLPAHLRPFVARQDYDSYTPRDHAVWRFLLHQLKHNLAQSAQSTYLDGLRRTGISIDAIPRIEDINACLSELDWRAVVVDGFLPPAIFMEFQAIKVLVIAVNMRSFEHMLYTPAPDIVHESAGHAPFLIDIDYAEFLQRFGELGMQAIANQADMAVYEAVRALSIVKETVTATALDIEAAEKELNTAVNNNDQPSEAALLARLHWWTVEYGLVGELDNYFIFGAGLLSSLGESVSCQDDDAVKKHLLTVDAINLNYDITATQPQLFITESCRHLSQILEEFGRSMACNQGGASALETARIAGTVNTIETNSGLQIAGKIDRVVKDAVENAIYFATSGPTQLAFEGEELEGQGLKHHPHGFSSPLGRLVGFERCLSSYTVDELKRHHIEPGTTTSLTYLSGIRVTGRLESILRRRQKNILLTFNDCTVTDAKGTILFDPSWGRFDLAVGDSVISVKGGSADKDRYPLFAAPSRTSTEAQKYDGQTLAQLDFYKKIRTLRETNASERALTETVNSVLDLDDPDWLLLYECLEILEKQAISSDLIEQLKLRLTHLETESDDDTRILIDYAMARDHTV